MIVLFCFKEGNCSWRSGEAAGDVAPVNRPAEDSKNLIWRVLLGERPGSDGVLANISTNQLHTFKDGSSTEAGPLELDYSSLEPTGFLNGSLLEFTLNLQRNDTGDGLPLNRTVTTGLRNNGRGNRTR